jgi:hypothetical protein
VTPESAPVPCTPRRKRLSDRGRAQTSRKPSPSLNTFGHHRSGEAKCSYCTPTHMLMSGLVSWLQSTSLPSRPLRVACAQIEVALIAMQVQEVASELGAFKSKPRA